MEAIRVLLQKLENELKTEHFIHIYEEARKKHSILQNYQKPDDLLVYLHDRTNPDYVLNDRLFLILISEYQNHPEYSCFGSLLLVLFKTGLISLFKSYRSRTVIFPSLNESDLWSVIISYFFEETSRYDMQGDKEKVASKILGRIRNRLRSHFRELFKTLSAEIELQKEPEISSFSESIPDAEEMKELLQRLVQLEVITDTDKYILLATSIFGKSMKDLSLEMKELSYESIRQRKVRAGKAIKAFFKKNKNILSQS